MYHKTFMTILMIFVSFLLNPLFGRDFPKPDLMLANVYHKGLALENYWVSEKYDGVRAIWDGQQLISRGGNIYHAPKWFIENFPRQKLDGELWISRQSFELLVSTVRDDVPSDSAWKMVKFMVFDMPENSGEQSMPFDIRLERLNNVIHEADIKWLIVVKQWKVKDHQALMKQLDEITKAGAEGLMLHRGSSLYVGKRNGDLLKLKPYEDAEAVVIKHLPGKGKFTNMLGAIIVEMPEGKQFKIGTGFSNKERARPPEIGSTITYQYRGKSKNGIPRFASFLRIREVK